MERIKTWLLMASFIAIGILLMLKQCNGPLQPKEVYIKGKDSIHYVSVPAPYKVTEFKTKWYPKWDTIKQADTTWNADLCNFERTYNDSTANDSITIYSKIQTVGILKSQQLSYRWKAPSITKETFRTDTLIRPNKWQFFVNTEVGGNNEQFNASLGADLVYKKAEVGYRYDLVQKTHNVKVGYRLFKSRK